MHPATAALLPEAIVDAMLVPLWPFISASVGADPANAVGLLNAAVYMPLLVTNLVWGAVSDQIGVKPVLLVSLSIVLVSTASIAFATTFEMIFWLRFLVGIFGASSTVIKGSLGKIPCTEKRIQAYAHYESVYSIAGIVGPSIGGALTATYFRQFLPFLEVYQYALPCLFGAFLCLVAIITTSILVQFRMTFTRTSTRNSIDYQNVAEHDEEELSFEMSNSTQSRVSGDTCSFDRSDTESSLVHRRSPRISAVSHPACAGVGDADCVPSDRAFLPASTFTLDSHLENNMPLIHTVPPLPPAITHVNAASSPAAKMHYIAFKIALYCTIALLHSMYQTSIPLFFKTIGFSPQVASFLMTGMSFGKLAGQLYIYPVYLQKPFTTTKIFQLSMACFIILISAPLVTCSLIGMYPELHITILSVYFFVLGAAEAVAYMSSILLVTESALETGDAASLGLVHGIATSCAAIMRSAGPVLSGWLVASGSAVEGCMAMRLVIAAEMLVAVAGFVLSAS